MNESRLDKGIKNLSNRQPPNLPDDFNATVLAKIREKAAVPEKRTGGLGWFRTLVSTFATPEWAAAAAAVTLFLGWNLGRISAGSETRPVDMVATVTGEVVDLACYYDDGGSGPAHAACARRCIESGLPVGLKSNDGKVYVLVGKQLPPDPDGPRHETLNMQLAKYAGQTVTINGRVVRKMGLSVIENAEMSNVAKTQDGGSGLAKLAQTSGSLPFSAISGVGPDASGTEFAHFLREQLAGTMDPHSNRIQRQTE